MNLNHVNYKQYENNYNTFHFTKCSQICDYVHALAKSKVSRDKLNYLSQANDSTPQNRAFFVRNIRTPKEYADFVFNLNPIILSMVERNGQPLAVGCLPVMAVCHPVTFYRQTVTSLAVDSENLSQESTQMYQFIFAAIRRTDLTNHIQKIRITADTEQAARAQFARDFVLVLTGKINLQNNVKNDRTFTAISRDSMEVAHA
ncbi:host cell division inhibitor Icd-like protein [Haemophilus pittmaniae]|uniref:host cell division inhibitor Icd-like protein n=1 Tax=Haemophilus pittmaniae TaxID=249188 RepID=UPI000E0E87AF|nr:host cell division inhibitor Icd-like protein [Haemophilus pittmaniae]